MISARLLLSRLAGLPHQKDRGAAKTALEATVATGMLENACRSVPLEFQGSYEHLPRLSVCDSFAPRACLRTELSSTTPEAAAVRATWLGFPLWD